MPCWIWGGCVDKDGYGQARVSRKTVQVHRASYEALVGPIPTGLQLDHLCRNRACYNPAHLEPVTPTENMRRGIKGALTTSCPSGHPYDAENTYVDPRGHRFCRTCGRAAASAYRIKKRSLL